MRIAKVAIHNYRSIRCLEMRCGPLMVLLGPNNHGKSNIVSAIEFALSTSAKPAEDDFFAFREANELWVELTFEDLTDQERTTFRRYVRADGSVCVRKTATLADGGEVQIAYNGYAQEPEEWWLQSDSIHKLITREQVGQTLLADLVPSGGKLRKADIADAQAEYIQDHREDLSFQERLEEGPFLGAKNVGGGLVPDLYLVPAVRDLTEETKVKTTTTFGRLLNRAVQEMAERDPRFQEIREDLGELIASLNAREEGSDERPQQLVTLEKNLASELDDWGVSVAIEVTPPAIERIFELGTNLHLDDGLKTPAEEKGHGLQRAVIFALLKAWARALRAVPGPETGTSSRRSSESIVFAFEEPELFLHPHAQRGLARAIREIAETPEHQIFVCTHSTHFVDLDHYKEICVVTKPTVKEGTVVRQCTEELFGGPELAERKRRFHMAQWVNPDRGEMFFAKHVVFVEGETEKAVLPFLAQKLDCLDPDVSVIDCGGKFNLPLYIAIANAFKLRYGVVHDEDPLPTGIPPEWSTDRVIQARRTCELNAEIAEVVDRHLGDVFIVKPDFEGAAGVSRSQADTKGKALAALDHFESKAIEEIPENLKKLARFAYKLPDLQ